MVFLPLGRALLKPRGGIYLVHQEIAPMAGASNCLRRSRVTGDHNAAVCSVEAISIRKIPRAVSYSESVHRDIGIFVNHSWLNLMRVDVICLGVSTLQSVDAYVGVFHISRLNMPRHVRE